MMSPVSGPPPTRTRRGAPERAALAVGAAQAVLAAAILVSLLATSRYDGPTWEIRRELAPVDLVLGVLYGALGTLVVTRSRHAVGWAFVAIGWGYTATAGAIAWTVLGLAEPGLPAQAWVHPLILAGWTSATLLSFLVLPFLLTPGPPVGRSRRLALAGVGVVALATTLRLLLELPGGPDHPLTSGRVSDAAWVVDGWLIPVYVVLALGVAASVVLRMRAAPPEERRGLAWLLSAQLAVASSYLVFEIGVSLDGRWFVVGSALLIAAESLLLGAVFVLIRRQPAWRVDLAISRTLVGLLLTVSLVVAYVVAVWALGTVAPWRAESSGLVVVAALALAVLPLRDGLQRQVERLVFGSGADPSVLLERVARTLATGGGEGAQLTGLADALRRALRLGRVEVRVHGTLAASAGRAEADDDLRAVTIDLPRDGEVVGALRVVPPRGERLDPRTVRLLGQISGLVGVAAQLDEAYRAVEEARARVLEVREQERRLLRRELHDGIGPALSGTALALAAVPATSRLSPDDAVLLRRLVEELSRRADDVRQMARVLLPPVLDEGRLGEALALLAERHSVPRFAVSVSAPGADRLDGRRQAVVYQVAAEAVRNAARHSGARRCLVRVEIDADVVRLEVRDDGRGFDAAATPAGVGLASMRERAAEVGGDVTVDSDEGGTRVVMVLR